MPIISLKTGTKSRSLLVGNPYFVPSSYESIASVNGTGSFSITFSSIPQTYKHLQIRALVKDNGATSSLGGASIYLNGDTGANYAWHSLEADGASVAAWRGTSTSLPYIGGNTYGWLPYNGYTNMFGVMIIDIHDYSSTTKNKTVRTICGSDVNGSGAIKFGSNLWMNTAAVTSISIYDQDNSWTTGSSFALYGIKG